MLVFRILATVFVGWSIITAIFKNIVLIDNDLKKKVSSTIFWCLYSLLWRSFVITAIWII